MVGFGGGGTDQITHTQGRNGYQEGALRIPGRAAKRGLAIRHLYGRLFYFSFVSFKECVWAIPK